jgi:hypothetical protein
MFTDKKIRNYFTLVDVKNPNKLKVLVTDYTHYRHVMKQLLNMRPLVKDGVKNYRKFLDTKYVWHEFFETGELYDTYYHEHGNDYTEIEDFCGIMNLAPKKYDCMVILDYDKKTIEFHYDND